MSTPNGIHAAELLEKMRKNKDFHDIQLVAELDGKRIPAHRLVMMAMSEYFCALLGRNFKEGEQDEVTITGVDGPTLQLIIDFCYSGHIEINEDNFHQIIDAALPMGLVRIEQKCERFGIDILETSNCLDLFLVAERYSLDELRRKSWDLICNIFEAFPASELCEMSLSFITELLKSDRIHAREDLIFHRLVDWIAADEKVRSQYASDLLKLIHMDKLTFSVFIEDVTSFAKKFGDVDSLLNGHDCRAKSDGMSTNCYRCEIGEAEQLFAVSFKYERRNDIISMINVDKYNPITDRWTLHRNVPITNDEMMPTSNSFGLMFSNDGIFLIGGHRDFSSYKKIDAYFLDPEGMRLVKNDANMRTDRGWFSPIFYKGRIFIFGGYDGERGMDLATCVSFSLQKLSTEHVAPMKFSRNRYAAAVLDDKIYVVGGGTKDTNQIKFLRSAECYDPKSKKWTTIADMIHPRNDFAVVKWNGMLYAMGGHETVEHYDPTKNLWTEIGYFDGSNEVIRAVNWQNEIYVMMKNGRFGKVTVEPVCTFLPLRNSPYSSGYEKHLFIN